MTAEKNIQVDSKEEGLKKLAASLILNAIETSCEDRNEFNDAFKFFINEKHRDNSDTLFWKDMNLLTSRNILIIGNGATMDALGKSQKAEDLANEIIAKVKVKYGDPLVKRQIDRLKTAYDLNEADFETKLSACAALDEEFVRKELKAALNYKYIPSRFYEIVGHLFKHRYIDVIINFNHDEILDEIIKEELNDSDYNHIFFDGHCPVIDDGSKVTELLKVPIYIKPHGTISYDNSMLFTKEHYHNEASGLKKFLHYIFTAKYREPHERDPKLLDLNIIVAGCRLASSELNQIMDDALMERRGICENIANMFVFDTSEKEDFLYDHNPNAYAKYKNFGQLFGSEIEDKTDRSESRVELQDKSYKISNEYILHGNFHYFKVDEDNTLGNQFQKLSSQIESFTSDFPPKNRKSLSGHDKILKRGIARHLLISELFCQPNANYRFYSKNRSEKTDDIFIEKSGDEINIYIEEVVYKLDDKKELIKSDKNNLFKQKKAKSETDRESSSIEFISYCKSRTIIEIIILGLQSRELLNITTIKESRAGKYYQLYVENSNYLINDYHLEDKQYEAVSLIDLLKVVGYKKYKGYTNETFQFAPEQGKTILKKGKPTEKEIDFTVLVKEIPRLEKLDVKIVSKYFKAIKNSINYNIKPKFREYKLTNVSFNSIRNSNLLNSDIKYHYNFSKFFRETDTYGFNNWNVLLAIAERGEFIKNYLVDSVFSQDIESHKYISLVIADYCLGESSQTVNHLSKVNLIDSDSANAHKLDNIPAIPFWLHNQHMFLFLDVKQNVEPTLVGGIHYESRLLSKNVCPVFITNDNKEDLRVMLTTFIEYWTKGHLHRNTSLYKQKIANICMRNGNKLPDFYNPIYDEPTFTEIQKLLFRQVYSKVYPGKEPLEECLTIIEHRE